MSVVVEERCRKLMLGVWRVGCSRPNTDTCVIGIFFSTSYAATWTLTTTVELRVLTSSAAAFFPMATNMMEIERNWMY